MHSLFSNVDTKRLQGEKPSIRFLLRQTEADRRLLDFVRSSLRQIQPVIDGMRDTCDQSVKVDSKLKHISVRIQRAIAHADAIGTLNGGPRETRFSFRQAEDRLQHLMRSADCMESLRCMVAILSAASFDSEDVEKIQGVLGELNGLLMSCRR